MSTVPVTDVFGDPSCETIVAFGDPSCGAIDVFGDPSCGATDVFGDPRFGATYAFSDPTIMSSSDILAFLALTYEKFSELDRVPLKNLKCDFTWQLDFGIQTVAWVTVFAFMCSSRQNIFHDWETFEHT